MKTLLSVVVVAILGSISSPSSSWASEDPIKRSLRTRNHGIALLLGARDKGGVTSGGGGSSSEEIERCFHMVSQSGPISEPDTLHQSCGLTIAASYCAMVIIQSGQPSSEAVKCIADSNYHIHY